MALCIKVTPCVHSVIEAFAMVDCVMKSISLRDDPDGPQPMQPQDDFYMAPFAVVPLKRRRSKTNPEPQQELALVFTSYKARQPHRDAVEKLHPRDARPRVDLCSGTKEIEELGIFGVKVKRAKWTVFREYASAGGDDVCTKLEDHAFGTTCAALGFSPEQVASAMEEWRPKRAAQASRMTAEEHRSALAAAPLAELPEWSEEPFFPLDSPLRTEGERQAALVRAAREQETRKRKREELEEHLDAKKKRYAPALAAAKAKHPDPSVIDEEETCVTVFEASEDYGNEEPIRCPYDRKNGGLFCSMCLVMAERCGA